jgi:NAD(P)H-nitrite reductase large subunit
LIVVAESGVSFPADLVILAIGVRPETELAKAAGLQIGSRGGIVVDAQMRTPIHGSGLSATWSKSRTW